MVQGSQTSNLVDGSKPKRPLMTLLAVVGGVVTVAALGVTLYNHFSSRSSSAETLVVQEAPTSLAQSGPAEAEEETQEQFRVVGVAQLQTADQILYAGSWRIPVDAPIETFPLELTPGPNGYVQSCSDEQLAWLTEYATPVEMPGGDLSSDFRTVVRNDATAGSALSLGNLRFEGVEASADPVIAFECPGGGVGGGGAQGIALNVDGSPAVSVADQFGYGFQDIPEGAPATINLQPGEELNVMILRDDLVDTSRQYEGRLLADVLDGSGETVVLYDNMLFARTPEPGYFVGYSKSAEFAGSFVCRNGEGVTRDTPWQEYPSPYYCTLEEAAALLRNAAASSTR